MKIEVVGRVRDRETIGHSEMFFDTHVQLRLLRHDDDDVFRGVHLLKIYSFEGFFCNLNKLLGILL